MSGFKDALSNGLGTIIKSVFRSPDYSTGVAGWSINKDGSAEFNNLTIRGTFNGTDFIMNSAGIFFYNGAPAHGNLVGWWTISSGTDAFGNTYVAGFVVTDGTSLNSYVQMNQLAGQVAIFFQPDATAFSKGDITAYQISGAPSLQLASPQSTVAGSTPATINLGGSDPGGGPSPAQIINSCDTYVLGLLGVQTYAQQSNETWHTPSYGTNWAGSTTFNGIGRPTLRYRIDAEDNLWLLGAFKAGGVLPANPVFMLPVGWRPIASGNIFIQRNNGGALSTGSCFISNSGNVDLFAGDGMGIAINNEYYINGKVPLGNLA